MVERSIEMSAGVAGGVQPRSEGDSVIVTTDVAVLSRIYEPAVNVIVLERALTPAVAAAATALLSIPGFERKLAIVPDDRGRRALRDSVERDALVDDILFWAEVIAELTDAELVGVRLARRDHAMCPRFHVDRVLVRIITTYIGAGTEYLASPHADRRFLGGSAGEVPDETSGLLRDGAVISRAPTGAVVVLKGEAWPDNVGRGAIHRSPATSVEAPRLLLTLDALG